MYFVTRKPVELNYSQCASCTKMKTIMLYAYIGTICIAVICAILAIEGQLHGLVSILAFVLAMVLRGFALVKIKASKFRDGVVTLKGFHKSFCPFALSLVCLRMRRITDDQFMEDHFGTLLTRKSG